VFSGDERFEKCRPVILKEAEKGVVNNNLRRKEGLHGCAGFLYLMQPDIPMTYDP